MFVHTASIVLSGREGRSSVESFAFRKAWLIRVTSVWLRQSEMPTGPSDSVARMASSCTWGCVLYPECVRSEEVGGCGDEVQRVSLLRARR